MRYFSTSIRFVFFYICDIRELLKRVISLPKLSLHFYLFADLDIVINALFICLNSLCILFYLILKRASKTRYFSADGHSLRLSEFVLFSFFHPRKTCVWSQLFLYSFQFSHSDIVLFALFLSLSLHCISMQKFSLYSYLFADSDILLNALFLCLKPLWILYYLQHKWASKTRFFSAKVFFVFLSFCRFRHRF